MSQTRGMLLAVGFSAIVVTALIPAIRKHMVVARLAALVEEYSREFPTAPPSSFPQRLTEIRRCVQQRIPETIELVELLRDPRLQCEARFHVTATLIGTLPPPSAAKLLAAMLRFGISDHDASGPYDHCLRQIAHRMARSLPDCLLSDEEFDRYLILVHSFDCGLSTGFSTAQTLCRGFGSRLPSRMSHLDWMASRWDRTPEQLRDREEWDRLPIQERIRSQRLADALRHVGAVNPSFPFYEDQIATVLEPDGD